MLHITVGKDETEIKIAVQVKIKSSPKRLLLLGGIDVRP